MPGTARPVLRGACVATRTSTQQEAGKLEISMGSRMPGWARSVQGEGWRAESLLPDSVQAMSPLILIFPDQ